MHWSGMLPRRGRALLPLLVVLWGCGPTGRSHPLDADVARDSVQKAMQAWVDGRTPQDLQPEIIIGDTAWDQGQKLVSFEILREEETSDGSNLHIRVRRKFAARADNAESKVIYIVGTSPVITIFPQ